MVFGVRTLELPLRLFRNILVTEGGLIALFLSPDNVVAQRVRRQSRRRAPVEIASNPRFVERHFEKNSLVLVQRKVEMPRHVQGFVGDDDFQVRENAHRNRVKIDRCGAIGGELIRALVRCTKRADDFCLDFERERRRHIRRATDDHVVF